MSAVRKGDEVMVISGKEKGKRGKVLRLIIGEEGHATRVVVEKLALVKRHAKATQGNRTGGIVEKEASIAISSVMLIDPKTDKPTRVKNKVVDGKKVRIAKSGEALS